MLFSYPYSLSWVVSERITPDLRFPEWELLDLRALLLYRHQWVRLRTRLQNALQAIALAHGLRRGSSLWSYNGQHTIAMRPLAQQTAYRQDALQSMYARMKSEIENLNQRVEEQARQRSGAQLLITIST